MKKVVILKIDTYDKAVLEKRIEEALDTYFPLDSLFSPKDKLLIKPNFLMAAEPQEAVVTHPNIIEAVGVILKKRGLAVSIGDSPGGFASEKNMDALYDALGIKEFAKALGFDLLYPNQSVIRENFPLCWWADPLPSARTSPDSSPLPTVFDLDGVERQPSARTSLDSSPLSTTRASLDSSLSTKGSARGYKMINMPKLKTHEIMVLTLATKNLYGCISGLHKSNLHRAHPQTIDFAKIIVKLYKMIKPSLNIVDGILGMEGHGPAKNGKPRNLGVVVIGDDALYTDYAIGRLLGLEDCDNPLIKLAKEEGLIQESELEVISEVGSRLCHDFDFPAPFILNSVPGPVLGLLKSLFKFKPRINSEKCTKCLKCMEVCPQKAIDLLDKSLVIDYQKCIMCMCCAEMCRFGAVDLERSLLLRIIKKLRSVTK